jgi:hypothetical protein
MRRRWIAATALGEAAGIALVAVAYAAVDRGLAPPMPAILVAGACEGLCLGLAQALVLRRAGVCGGCWMLATAAAAAVGYGLSLIGGAGGPGGDGAGAAPPVALALGAAAGVGAVMGVIMGAVQWNAARRQLAAAAWIARSALGWALAMPAIFLGAATVGEDWPLAAVSAAGAASGGIAGGLLGLATAPALPRGAPLAAAAARG